MKRSIRTEWSRLHKGWLENAGGAHPLIALIPLPRQPGTYLTHEAKGSDEAHDADTAIINAEGGHSSAEERKEYFI